MAEYRIRLSWGKHINFPIITAKSKKKAREIAEDMLAHEDAGLYEEDDRVDWEIKEKKGQ